METSLGKSSKFPISMSFSSSSTITTFSEGMSSHDFLKGCRLVIFCEGMSSHDFLKGCRLVIFFENKTRTESLSVNVVSSILFNMIYIFALSKKF